MYLFRLYRESKFASFAVSFFIVGTVICSFGKKVVTPFFAWNFFAGGSTMKWQQKMVNILINERDTIRFSDLPIAQRLFLHDQLYAVWLPMNEHNYQHPLTTLLQSYPNYEQKKMFLKLITNDSFDVEVRYPAYLKCYLIKNGVYTAPIKSLKIIKTDFDIPKK
ncbi:MAG: hypothetical protein RI894_2634 [Bacteroidota bacterium]|jgi:hypothetical protein